MWGFVRGSQLVPCVVYRMYRYASVNMKPAHCLHFTHMLHSLTSKCWSWKSEKHGGRNTLMLFHGKLSAIITKCWLSGMCLLQAQQIWMPAVDSVVLCVLCLLLGSQYIPDTWPTSPSVVYGAYKFSKSIPSTENSWPTAVSWVYNIIHSSTHPQEGSSGTALILVYTNICTFRIWGQRGRLSRQWQCGSSDTHDEWVFFDPYLKVQGSSFKFNGVVMEFISSSSYICSCDYTALLGLRKYIQSKYWTKKKKKKKRTKLVSKNPLQGLSIYCQGHAI